MALSRADLEADLLRRQYEQFHPELPIVPLPPSSPPLPTVTAELARLPLTTSFPADTVVAPA